MVTKKFYGYENLSDLQLKWIAWVRDGSKPSFQREDTLLASTQTNLPRSISSPSSQPATKANPGWGEDNEKNDDRSSYVAPSQWNDKKWATPSNQTNRLARQPKSVSPSSRLRGPTLASGSWYARQARLSPEQLPIKEMQSHRKNGVEQKVRVPSQQKPFAPGSTTPSTLLRKPPTNDVENETERTSDLRHCSPSDTIWR